MGHANGFAADPVGKSDSAAETPARISDREAAEWAGLLLGQMAEPNQIAQLGLSCAKHQDRSASARPASNRAVATTHSQFADTAGVNNTGQDRLILNVDSETLGRVQLVVDRDEGGVRVLVGGNASARNRLSEGKHTLRDALSAAGVRVNSLRIISSNEVGTVLARDLMSKKSRLPAERSEASTKERDKSSRSKRNNLNLIG